MPRPLEIATLEGAAKYYASEFLADRKPRDRAWVVGQFHQFAYKDEFDVLVELIRDEFGKKAVADFETRLGKLPKRTDEALKHELAVRKAIDMNGSHLKGKIGSVECGGRAMGTKIIEVEAPDSIQRRRRLGLKKNDPNANRVFIHRVTKNTWPIYAGEAEERESKSGVADPFPDVGDVMTMMALNTRISSETAIAILNLAVEFKLDEGTLGCIVQGYNGTQATPGPDTAVGTQTKLFVCEQTGTDSFQVATDTTDDATMTANAFGTDAALDTKTLTWCRAGASSSAGVELDAHVDGSAGTATVDWVFNTAEIVTSATVSITSWNIVMPEF